MKWVKDIKQHIVSTTGTESQMTVKYLKDVSTMQTIVSVLTEGSLKRHFAAEREILKLMFTFDHITVHALGTHSVPSTGIL